MVAPVGLRANRVDLLPPLYPTRNAYPTERDRGQAAARVVPRVIRRVQLASQKELELKAAQQDRRRREDERKEAARVLSERRENYQRWEKVLLDGADTWERAKQLRSFVAKLAAENGPDASDFNAWAGEYISQLDPVVQFEPPGGGVPDLDHEQEAHLRRQPAPGLSDLWRT